MCVLNSFQHVSQGNPRIVPVCSTTVLKQHPWSPMLIICIIIVMVYSPGDIGIIFCGRPSSVLCIVTANECITWGAASASVIFFLSMLRAWAVFNCLIWWVIVND